MTLPDRYRLARGPGLAAIAAAALVWCTLAPWRPVLAGDDFGYYESVVRSVVEDRVIVSDWLNPFTVGLTIPAEAMVRITGNLWPGCMFTVFLFGLVGLGSLWRLLGLVGVQRRGWGVWAWAFFPAWMAKWTHFESAVPAASLMLLALMLYLEAERHVGPRLWAFLVAASICAAWAISVRQNHVVLVAVGCLGLLLQPNGGRVGRLICWLLLPLSLFLYLQFGRPNSYAQAHMLTWQLSTFTLTEFAGRALRGWFFSCGCVAGLLLLTDFSRFCERLRRIGGFRWFLGGASVVVLIEGAFSSGSFVQWLAPRSDVLYLERFPILLALTAAVGGLLWPALLHQGNAGSSTARRTSAGTAIAAMGYVLLAAVWGYWEYYYLEVILLLWLSAAASLPARMEASNAGQAMTSRLDYVLRSALVAAMAASWYGQKVLLDFQSAQIQIVEQSFREKLVLPVESRGVPFGLSGWNLLPGRVEAWQQNRQGNPLAFWEKRDAATAVYFDWRPDFFREGRKGTVLRRGTMRVGVQTLPWAVVRLTAKAQDGRQGTHRYLPLTASEWQSYLRAP